MQVLSLVLFLKRCHDRRHTPAQQASHQRWRSQNASLDHALQSELMDESEEVRVLALPTPATHCHLYTKTIGHEEPDYMNDERPQVGGADYARDAGGSMEAASMQFASKARKARRSKKDGFSKQIFASKKSSRGDY